MESKPKNCPYDRSRYCWESRALGSACTRVGRCVAEAKPPVPEPEFHMNSEDWLMLVLFLAWCAVAVSFAFEVWGAL